MSSSPAPMASVENDLPIIQSEKPVSIAPEQGSLERLERMLMGFEYGLSQGITHGLDNRLADAKRDFNGGQALAQQGEAAMQIYIDQAKKTVEETLSLSTLEHVKQALEKSAEGMHAAYVRGDYHEMGAMTSAVVLASIDPDKLKQLEQLKRFGNVADGIEHVDGAADAVKKIDKVSDHAPEVPKPYAHDMNPDQAHDPDAMRGRQTGPVTIGNTVYESGKPPRKLGADETPPLKLVEKDGIDPAEILKPRSRQSANNTAPAQEENEHLALKAGVGLTTLAGLAFGAVKYHEAQRTHRMELGDAYRMAVDVNNYADAPDDRLSRYTATIQKYPELENAIKLFEGVRVSSAKDGFTYQEVEAMKNVVANTTERIQKNELSQIAAPAQEEAASRQLEPVR